MAKENSTKVIVDRRNLKRIAITCRCGLRTIHEVPGEALNSAAIPVLECPQCQTSYAVRENKIMRLNSELEPEKTIEKESVPFVSDGELPDVPMQPASSAVN